MPKALITGASGFVGPYLAQHLKGLGYEVWGTSLSGAAHPDFQPLALDVREPAQVQAVITRLEPDDIYHLAAISRPALKRAKDYYDVNLYGTLHVMDAAQDTGARVLVVSSAYVYGRYDHPIAEVTPLAPNTPYGASKAAAELASISYAVEGAQVVRVRPFNHTGPGQSPDFFLPTLVQQLARIKAGRAEPVLKLGNLEAVRDICDVRDVVRAYPKLLREGRSGDVYNLASGVGVSMRQLVDKALELFALAVELQTDPQRRRKVDIPYLVGDAGKLRLATGWQPRYTLQQTLADMIAAAETSLNA